MSIHHRPAEVNDRSQFGHWEGDLMIFRREHGQANITTLVERKIRYVLIFRNNDRQSRRIMKRVITELSPLAQTARHNKLKRFAGAFRMEPTRKAELAHPTICCHAVMMDKPGPAA